MLRSLIDKADSSRNILRHARSKIFLPVGSLLNGKRSMFAKNRVVQSKPFEVMITKSISSFLRLFFIERAPETATSLTDGIILSNLAKKTALLSFSCEYFARSLRIRTIFLRLFKKKYPLI